jgi:hypothetical protein
MPLFTEKLKLTLIFFFLNSMNILTCALWDKYGTAFLEGYSQCDGKEPVIVIIKHDKIKEPQGML